MAHVLIMPRQGNTVESCIIVRWKVAEGEKVLADQAVCEVETDKASFEVPAGASGTLLKMLHPEGDDVPVLNPIAVIGEKGEDWHAALAGAGAAVPAEAASAAAAPAASSAKAPAAKKAEATPASANAAAGARGVSPRARSLAAREGLDPSGLAGTGPGGRVIERDVVSALAARPALTAAARAAAASGAPVPPFGCALGGRAGLADLVAGGVVAAAPAFAATSPARLAGREARGEESFTETPVKSIRKIIADRMRASLASTAQLTFNGSARAERVLALRARFKASDKSLGLSEVTIGDLVLYAVSRTLPKFPAVNSHLVDGTLRTFARVHLGLAVDTPRGLMVPVIRNADLLSLKEISAESKRLASACNAGNVNPDDLTGGTFTVSNLGAFGIESFTPVLNAPEVGILGVDAVTNGIVAGPDGRPAIEPRMGLSLTVDHQIIDGAPAARILKAIGDAIADIDLLLME